MKTNVLIVAAALLAVGLVSYLLLAGVKKSMPESVQTIEHIVEELSSDDIEKREAALKQLANKKNNGLTIEEGLYALEAAGRQFPPLRYDFLDTSSELIEAAMSSPGKEYIAEVERKFSSYNKTAKVKALELLTVIDDREASRMYMQLIGEYAGEGGLLSVPTRRLKNKPKHADIFFPGLMVFAKDDAYKWDIYLLLLSYLQSAEIQNSGNEEYTTPIFSDFDTCATRLSKAQHGTGIAWMWDEEYQKDRSTCALLLDIMGYVDAPDVIPALRSTLSYRDPRLKMFAVLSLLRHGQDVGAEPIKEVASSSESRNIFFDQLSNMGMSARYPAELRSQAHFAESDMVGWLTYPTELGRVPDEIELMQVVSVDTESSYGIIDYYVFRFRSGEPHWSAEDGWIAGVSGPFIRKEGPSTKAYGDTFSTFEKWGERTPQEIVGNVQDILEEWRKSE